MFIIATMLQLAPPSHPQKIQVTSKIFERKLPVFGRHYNCLTQESRGNVDVGRPHKRLFPWGRGWTLAQSFSWNYTPSYLHKFCNIASSIVRKYISSWSKIWHYLQHCPTNIFSTYFIFKFLSLLQFSRKPVYDKSLSVRNVHHCNS